MNLAARHRLAHSCSLASISSGGTSLPTVREAARRHGLGLIDLQASLQAKELFTDGEHFTVAGNVMRAQLLLPFFLERL